ncbi:hypothetical protein BDZ89DRAFT_1240054 [Hymenopellis radicata]|nr:hypothetical protein BDZ89DRAFT_1240054 [Hymenopellis radicata]
MASQLYVPLNWFTDDKLEMMLHRLHELETKQLRPESTPDNLNPEKITTFDMTKMVKLWGSDEDSSCLTPLMWQETAQNMENALVVLSESALVSQKESRHNYAAQFRLHRSFFVRHGHFEENYPHWYVFERTARHNILKGYLFDREYYAKKVDTILEAKKQGEVTLAALRTLTPHTSPVKCSSDTDLRSANAKAPRTPGNDSPSSFRGGETSSSFPSSPARAATCVACAGPHRLRDHPGGATMFIDGKPCFSILRDGVLWAAQTLNTPSPQRICVPYNLTAGCSSGRHDASVAHICSFCGKNHPAISSSSSCPRHAAAN